MTAEELTKCVSDHPKNQSQIASDIGITRATIGRWMKGDRKISKSDTKLLRLYFFGEMPFDMISSQEDLSTQLRFTTGEWQIITILANREGFLTPRDWITSRIRGYLDNNPTY
jgi:transcriptional regulator with XRE-family HTH domain